MASEHQARRAHPARRAPLACATATTDDAGSLDQHEAERARPRRTTAGNPGCKSGTPSRLRQRGALAREHEQAGCCFAKSQATRARTASATDDRPQNASADTQKQSLGRRASRVRGNRAGAPSREERTRTQAASGPLRRNRSNAPQQRRTRHSQPAAREPETTTISAERRHPEMPGTLQTNAEAQSIRQASSLLANAHAKRSLRPLRFDIARRAPQSRRTRGIHTSKATDDRTSPVCRQPGNLGRGASGPEQSIGYTLDAERAWHAGRLATTSNSVRRQPPQSRSIRRTSADTRAVSRASGRPTPSLALGRRPASASTVKPTPLPRVKRPTSTKLSCSAQQKVRVRPADSFSKRATAHRANTRSFPKRSN